VSHTTSMIAPIVAASTSRCFVRGTEDDVRVYVDGDHLLELWDEPVLPPSVREAWTPWIEDHRRAG
jgi:hypothetical protein